MNNRVYTKSKTQKAEKRKNVTEYEQENQKLKQPKYGKAIIINLDCSRMKCTSKYNSKPVSISSNKHPRHLFKFEVLRLQRLF